MVAIQITGLCPSIREFELRFRFERTIVSDRVSRHLGEFKLHFNNFLILESTDNPITSELWYYSPYMTYLACLMF